MYNVKGAYSALTAYAVNDLVTVGDAVYRCVKGGTGKSYADTEFWVRVPGEIAEVADLVCDTNAAVATVEAKIPVLSITEVKLAADAENEPVEWEVDVPGLVGASTNFIYAPTVNGAEYLSGGMYLYSVTKGTGNAKKGKAVFKATTTPTADIKVTFMMMKG